VEAVWEKRNCKYVLVLCCIVHCTQLTLLYSIAQKKKQNPETLLDLRKVMGTGGTKKRGRSDADGSKVQS